MRKLGESKASSTRSTTNTCSTTPSFGNTRTRYRRAGCRRRRTSADARWFAWYLGSPARIAAPASERVHGRVAHGETRGLHRVDGYLQLRRAHRVAEPQTLRFLLECRADGKRVVGYGAPGKGNTLLNYCGIRSDLLEYIVDRNPYKHGRFTPGTRIPIRDPRLLAIDRPDVVLALPWNLETELTNQLSYIAEWGGQLVFPLPTLHECDGVGN